jgi:type II secretory pathway component PulF
MATGTGWVDALAGLALVGLAIVAVFAFAQLTYVVLTAPLRRRERVRLFLAVIETVARRGQDPGQALFELSEAGATGLGWDLRTTSHRVESGEDWIEALRALGGYLPPRVVEMLALGRKVGDVRKVLPVCRHVLRDTSSRMHGALNYFVLPLLGFGLMGSFFVLFVISLYIFPQFEKMAYEIGEEGLGPAGWLRAVVPMAPLVGLAAAALVAAILAFYAGGPRLLHWLHLESISSVVFYLLPWRRKRMRRDFSAMLGVLLDAGVPEAEAVALAGKATANAWFERRAQRAAAALAQGETLPETVGRLDRRGELRWRLENAARERRGFRRALAGWHESLEARAFQQEQAAAQVITSALVVGFGAAAGAVIIGIFGLLVDLIKATEAALW